MMKFKRHGDHYESRCEKFTIINNVVACNSFDSNWSLWYSEGDAWEFIEEAKLKRELVKIATELAPHY